MKSRDGSRADARPTDPQQRFGPFLSRQSFATCSLEIPVIAFTAAPAAPASRDVAAADADAPVRKLGDGRPVAARDDAAALTLGMAVQGAPFLEGENGVVVLDQPLAKLQLLGAALLKPLLALLLGFGLLGGGALRTARARYFGRVVIGRSILKLGCPSEPCTNTKGPPGASKCTFRRTSCAAANERLLSARAGLRPSWS